MQSVVCYAAYRFKDEPKPQKGPKEKVVQQDCYGSNCLINYQLIFVLLLYGQPANSGFTSSAGDGKSKRCINGSQSALVLPVPTATGHNHTKPAKRKAL